MEHNVVANGGGAANVVPQPDNVVPNGGGNGVPQPDNGGGQLQPWRQLGATMPATLARVQLFPTASAHITAALTVLSNAKLYGTTLLDPAAGAALLASALAAGGSFPAASRVLIEARALVAVADYTFARCAPPLGLPTAGWIFLLRSAYDHVREARRLVAAAAAFAAAAEDALRVAVEMVGPNLRPQGCVAVAVEHLDNAAHMLVAAQASAFGLSHFVVRARDLAAQVLQQG